jgi:anti-sigma regulatory factor (Ser/Thr protein kinase)
MSIFHRPEAAPVAAPACGRAAARSRQIEAVIALEQAAFAAITHLDPGLRAAIFSPDALPDCAVSSSRLFPGSRFQVRAVRDYVRAGFASHAACDDAVLVASELATNSIEYSASGYDGGMFLIHLAVLSAGQVVIVVTDQGGPCEPCERHVDVGAESGRGLAVVRSLSSLLEFSDSAESRTVLAVISSADDDEYGKLADLQDRKAAR